MLAKPKRGIWINVFIVLSYVSALSLLGKVSLAHVASEKAQPEILKMASWQSLMVWHYVWAGAQSMLYIGAAEGLRNRFERKSVRFVIAVLWLAGPVTLFLAAIFYNEVFPEFVHDQVGPLFVQSLVAPILWTPYFLLSKHVKRLYPAPSR